MDNCYENKCPCGRGFYGDKLQQFCANCYQYKVNELQSKLETTKHELTATTISWENALAELQKAREQEPVAYVDLSRVHDKDLPYACFTKIVGSQSPVYAAPVPAMPIGFNQSLFAELNCIANSVEIADGESIDRQNALCHAANVIRSHANELLKDGPLVAPPAMPIPSHGDEDAAFENYLEGLGGVESNEWHDAPVDGVFKAGFAAGQRAMPMQDDRIAKEWQEIWNPIDELVRPLTPLGHSVAVKAVELIKQALAMPIPKQEPGAVPDFANNTEKFKEALSETLNEFEGIPATDIFLKSPRITEQDARDMVGKLEHVLKMNKDVMTNTGVIYVMNCIALLNKLNANAAAEVRQEPEYQCFSCKIEHGANGNCHLCGEPLSTVIPAPAQAAAIPEDWQLVPKNVSGEMVGAAKNVGIRYGYDGMDQPLCTVLSPSELYKLWDALLSAAPKPNEKARD